MNNFAEKEKKFIVLNHLPTKEEIQECMMKYVGIVRTEQSLSSAKRWLSKYGVRNMILQHDVLTNEEITLINMLTVCELIVVSALQREESIGGHYRSDYPHRNSVKRDHSSEKKTTTCVMREEGFMNTIKVKEALNRFFLEDIGERDVTSQFIFPDNLLSKGTFLAKDTGSLRDV